jgi:2'-5' RNA ligase
VSDADPFAPSWQSFLALDELLIAGDHDAWSRGRAQYLTFLVRIEDAAARDYIAGAIEAIADIQGVEPFPDWSWHITVKGAGFQVIKRTLDDDILREDVPRISGKARALLTKHEAFDARIGPINCFSEGPIIEVHDGGRITRLNTELLESMSGPELERGPYDGAEFLPHITIARFTSNDALARMKERLTSMRERPEAGPTMQVRRIDFVKAWLSEEVPEFDNIATYALRATK